MSSSKESLGKRSNLPETLSSIFQGEPQCKACGLCEKSYPVWPRGSYQSRVAWLSEAAGKIEEENNLTFVGPAGIKASDALKKIGVSFDQNFLIYNTCLCRPHPGPGERKENRAPTTDEIKACRHNVLKITKEFNPELIVAVGGIAAKAIMPDFAGALRKIVGKFFGPSSHDLEVNADLFVIYHPAYVLRNQNSEKDWILQLIQLRDYMISNDLIRR